MLPSSRCSLSYRSGLEPSEQQYQSRQPGADGSGNSCDNDDVVTPFPAIFLRFHPVQSVFAHWTSWDVKAANESNADSFQPH